MHDLPHIFRTVRKCGAAQCGCGCTLKVLIAIFCVFWWPNQKILLNKVVANKNRHLFSQMTYPQKITLSRRKLKKTFWVKNQVRAAPGPHSVLSAARTVRQCVTMCSKGLETLIVTKSWYSIILSTSGALPNPNGKNTCGSAIYNRYRITGCLY